ncbi:hypothetical protein Ahy_A10g049690 [Arachis hypogaea]|uniref:Uncharacterized protein n=1 Tax=Arachis hypogaea TaxID=3818 RepID=A0A445B7Q8_ARAHY|nr:hypothetical protein Ahy_A10g049690 [Arachis hypogaea]
MNEGGRSFGCTVPRPTTVELLHVIVPSMEPQARVATNPSRRERAAMREKGLALTAASSPPLEGRRRRAGHHRHHCQATLEKRHRRRGSIIAIAISIVISAAAATSSAIAAVVTTKWIEYYNLRTFLYNIVGQGLLRPLHLFAVRASDSHNGNHAGPLHKLGLSNAECKATVVAGNVPEAPPVPPKLASLVGTPVVPSLASLTQPEDAGTKGSFSKDDNIACEYRVSFMKSPTENEAYNDNGFVPRSIRGNNKLKVDKCFSTPGMAPHLGKL